MKKWPEQGILSRRRVWTKQKYSKHVASKSWFVYLDTQVFVHTKAVQWIEFY